MTRRRYPPDHSGATAWQSIGDIAEELARLRYVNQRAAKFSPSSVQSIMLAKLALDEGADYERAFRNCISTNFDGLLRADYIPPGDTGETPPGGENAGGAVVSGGKQRGENHHAGSLGRQGKTAS